MTGNQVTEDFILRRLDRFIGDWRMRAAINGNPTAYGHASFRWSTEGKFVVQHADSDPPGPDVPEEWIANSPFPTSCIIGADDSTQQFTMLYSDARDVLRVYQMSVTGDTWTLWRAAPRFHQRYTGQFSADGQTITGRWESSVDGTTWTFDFGLDYHLQPSHQPAAGPDS
jgi:hypothetical protein